MRDGHREPGLGQLLSVWNTRTRDRLGAIGVQARLNDDGSSFSGKERNSLFLSERGAAFCDVSALAAVDSPADGRAFAVWDPDRDGWPDLAVVNANAPSLQLFRNRLGSLPETRNRRSLALRLVGGNRGEAPRPGWSPRDAFGARVEVDLGGETIVRELAAGEGLAAQNSSTLLVGLGQRETVRGVTVHWPSGRVSRAETVSAGRLLTFFEDPDSTHLGALAVEAYSPAEPIRPPPPSRRARRFRVGDPSPAALTVYSTMATWCGPCLEELPRLARLRSRFPEEQLEMIGVPIDPEDTPAALEAWAGEEPLPYRLLSELPASERERVQRLVVELRGQDAVPATLITDASGRLLETLWGPPSLSLVRRLLEPVVAPE